MGRRSPMLQLTTRNLARLRELYKNLAISQRELDQAASDQQTAKAICGVHSLKGWAWMTCVRFEDNGHPRTYAVFIQDGKVIDSRYAVQIDACNTETYAAFDAMGPSRAGVLGPLY